MLLSPNLSIDLNETTWQALDQSLEHVDREIQQAAEEFLLDAARIIIDEIQSEAPRNPGYRGERERERPRRLADSFHSTPVQNHNGVLSIGFYEDESQATGWEGKSVSELVESGTKEHDIAAVNGKALAFPWGAGVRSHAGDLHKQGAGPHKAPRGFLRVNPKYPGGRRMARNQDMKVTRTKSDSTLFFFFQKVHHPGTAPNPFIQRALAQAVPKIEALAERIKEKVKIAWGGGSR